MRTHLAGVDIVLEYAEILTTRIDGVLRRIITNKPEAYLISGVHDAMTHAAGPYTPYRSAQNIQYHSGPHCYNLGVAHITRPI